MKGEIYNSVDLAGALRVGDIVRTNKNGSIPEKEMKWEGPITAVKGPSVWVMESSYDGMWNFFSNDQPDSTCKGLVEILYLDKHGLPNRQSLDEIIKLRKLETEVNLLMGR